MTSIGPSGTNKGAARTKSDVIVNDAKSLIGSGKKN